MGTWSCKYNLGDTVHFGDIKAAVSEVWFDDNIAAPNVKLSWVSHGEIKTQWIRESALIYLVGLSNGA
jgi:hypothetical protein